MLKLPLLALVLVFHAVSAVERPQIPPAGEDATLFKGKTAREFFKARAADTACQKDLAFARQSFVEQRDALARLLPGKDADRIDAQEAAMRRSRNGYLALLAKCGECATREIEKRVITLPARTEVWYISDGSCQLNTEDKTVLAGAYKKMAGSLTHLKQYPKEDPRAEADAPLKLSQGFFNLLEFVGVDGQTGALAPKLDMVEKSPFHSFISVRGPDLGVVKLAAGYYAKNEIKNHDEKFFHLTFEGERPPLGFKKPSVYVITASQRKTLAGALNIFSVMGSWYVNADGYLRYFTAADFGLSVKFMDQLAHEILLDTVAQLSERGQP